MSSFKSIAKEAKNRLKNGFWEKTRKIREEEITAMLNAGKDFESAKHCTEKKLFENLYLKKSANSESKLYKKVVSLLESDEFELDLIGNAMDREYYESLDSGARERYILSLSSQLDFIKNKYKKNKYIY